MSTPKSGSLTHVEQRGIEPVPGNERTGHPAQLFWVWFAANISILGLPLGATLVAFQMLNIWQAILVAVLGAAGSFAVVGIVSVAGRRGGAPGLTLSRAVFGSRGNMGPTFITLLSRLGWETVNTATAAFVLLSLFGIIAGTSFSAKEVPGLTLLGIGIFILLTVLVSWLGHSAILVIQKWATWIFGALNVVVSVFLITHVDWTAVGSAPAAPMSAVVTGIGVIAAGTGIGWGSTGADMARYQKKSSKALHLIASSAAGAGIPLVVLIALGALLAAGDPNLASAGDPVGAIREMLPTWMAVPYLIAAFGGLLLSNHLSVYAAGLTTLTLGLRTKRIYAVGVDVVVTFVGAVYFMLIADNFYGPFITFISLLAIPITAWLSVFLVDMIGRRTYDPAGLMDLSPAGRYWYKAGVSWRAMASWLAAIIVGLLFTVVHGSGSDILFAGWLHDTWIGESGVAWVATFTVGAVTYALLGGAKSTGTGSRESVDNDRAGVLIKAGR
ncbi:purine-cytosine permease family protein [Arthrobacter sp. 35W]|uniref:purine-cytosine permease family protein n=1 Tax=Arthrobacter sp. 35W TaxID=1132441 RepID=UPI000405B71A|nr:cytosine permease [Arthrobacter sp. 35W]